MSLTDCLDEPERERMARCLAPCSARKVAKERPRPPEPPTRR